MATLKSDIATAQDSLKPIDRINGRLLAGQVNWLESTYTCTGLEQTSGDTIDWGEIPLGAYALPELARVSNEASMGGGTLAITKFGDAGDDDRYTGTSTSVHSSNAAVQSLTPNVGASVIPRYSVTQANKRILSPFTCASAPTAGKKIKLLLPFIQP